jgi:2-methylcitrate dehydratase PrpD
MNSVVPVMAVLQAVFCKAAGIGTLLGLSTEMIYQAVQQAG